MWSASWCRSTCATSWPGGCGCCGRVSTAARRRARASPISSIPCGPAPVSSPRSPDVPELVFDWIGARAERFSAVPSLTMELQISETSGQPVDAIALRCQIRIEPQRRRYSEAEAQRLHDLFGDTSRWADTLKPLQFTTIAVMVPGFSGSTRLDLPVPFSYDLEIASTRYFASLDDGVAPLLLLFSGTVFTTVDGRLQVEQVPWSKEIACGLPAEVWREAVDAHFPDRAWITMSRGTLDGLIRFKTRHALPTWDATVRALLSRADREDQLPRPRSSSPAPGRSPTRSCTRGTC